MIQVYGMTSPNVVKVYIALDACGFDYQVKMVNVYDGEQHTPEFRALNPNGKVPILIDPDGPGGKPITLFESGAILLYLNEKSGGKLGPRDPADYWRAVTWLFQQHGGLGPMGGQLAHFYRFAPPGLDPYAEQRYRSENNRLYDLYDSELAKRPFIAGDTFTFADIAIWPWIVYHPFHGLDLKRRTHLNEWFERVGQIEAVKRGVAVHGPPLARPKVHDLDPDAMDRFFNRGRYTYT